MRPLLFSAVSLPRDLSSSRGRSEHTPLMRGGTLHQASGANPWFSQGIVAPPAALRAAILPPRARRARELPLSALFFTASSSPSHPPQTPRIPPKIRVMKLRAVRCGELNPPHREGVPNLAPRESVFCPCQAEFLLFSTFSKIVVHSSGLPADDWRQIFTRARERAILENFS